MGHTAVSATKASPVTLQFWQRGAKENDCKLYKHFRDFIYTEQM